MEADINRATAPAGAVENEPRAMRAIARSRPNDSAGVVAKSG
jgi:hypothetical protein